MKQQPRTLNISSQNKKFLAPDEPQPFSLIPPTSNDNTLSTPFLASRLLPCYFLAPFFFKFSSNKSHMHSDDSIQRVFVAYTSLNHPTVDIPDKLLESDPSPTNYSQTLFVPITSNYRSIFHIEFFLYRFSPHCFTLSLSL